MNKQSAGQYPSPSLKVRLKRLYTIRTRNAVAGYLFILPFIIGFLLFMVRPLFDSLYMSFCEVTVSIEGFSFRPIGWSNYNYAFTGDAEYNQLLIEEITKTWRPTRWPYWCSASSWRCF